MEQKNGSGGDVVRMKIEDAPNELLQGKIRQDIHIKQYLEYQAEMKRNEIQVMMDEVYKRYKMGQKFDTDFQEACEEYGKALAVDHKGPC